MAGSRRPSIPASTTCVQIAAQPWRRLAQLLLLAGIAAVACFLPGFDNIAQLGGFGFGLLAAALVTPAAHFSDLDRVWRRRARSRAHPPQRVKRFARGASAVVLVAALTVMYVWFYDVQVRCMPRPYSADPAQPQCDACRAYDCLKLQRSYCDNNGLQFYNATPPFIFNPIGSR